MKFNLDEWEEIEFAEYFKTDDTAVFESDMQPQVLKYFRRIKEKSK